jgi:Mannose-6-phosphate isomerase
VTGKPSGGEVRATHRELPGRASYLRSDGRLLCVLGVDGLVVVDTADAVLVAPIDRSQEVKALVADLEAEGMTEARTPARVHGRGAGTRPWTSATASA